MAAPPDRADIVARNVGVGCVTAVVGFFSGGMIAVFVGKFVGSMQGCQPAEGLPACNWWVYAGVGALIGVISLPFIALRRVNRPVVSNNSKR
jgi:hypothetical protein